MRILSFTFCAILCAPLAFGYTFIFQNGKTVEGTVLVEDATSVRILEKSGLQMTLKKNQMNLAAMKQANRKVETVEQKVEEAASVAPAPRKAVRTFRNWNVSTSPSIKPTSVKQTEKEYARLAAACRAAGGSPSMKKVLRTDYYNVDGKTVAVTGYWAHPSSIEEAKQICQKAIEAEATMQEARKTKTAQQETTAGSTSSTAGGYR